MQVFSALEQANVTLSEKLINGLEGCFMQKNLFLGLENEHYQHKYYATHFNLIVSIKLFAYMSVYIVNRSHEPSYWENDVSGRVLA